MKRIFISYCRGKKVVCSVEDPDPVISKAFWADPDPGSGLVLEKFGGSQNNFESDNCIKRKKLKVVLFFKYENTHIKVQKSVDPNTSKLKDVRIRIYKNWHGSGTLIGRKEKIEISNNEGRKVAS